MITLDDLNAALTTFDNTFDVSLEDKAAFTRGEFLQKYPIKNLKNLTVDDYVIGHGTYSFCSGVEAKTKSWANIQGANSLKFGIYYGKNKSDPTKKYRFVKKFGKTKNKAFENVRLALLDLIEDGKELSYHKIQDNPLSQMFKAKILSLYYPDIYLNVCSTDHLKLFANELGIPVQKYDSQYQHLLLVEKLNNSICKDWSNPKFMIFLFSLFVYKSFSTSVNDIFIDVSNKPKRKVNFEDINSKRDLIGKLSEKFALEWEKSRLTGLGFHDLIDSIEDRRDTPADGYDFLSYSAPNIQRCIEVKSVGRTKDEDCYRFFLSENEYSVLSNLANYYFYLVFYGKDQKPKNLVPVQAANLIEKSVINPCAYVIRFDMRKID